MTYLVRFTVMFHPAPSSCSSHCFGLPVKVCGECLSSSRPFAILVYVMPWSLICSFSTQYDLVELRAVMACLPAKFEVDADGRKAAWRATFLQRVQGLVAQVCVV